MDRKRQQADIIFRLGRLLGPLEFAASFPDRFDADEQERICARFLADLPIFYNEVVQFCDGEAGHRYGRQQEVIAGCYNDLQNKAVHTQRIEDLQSPLQVNRDRIIEQVLSIPVPIDSTIYEARTPFSTYCLVKDLCSTSRQQLVLLDRYFDQTVFHRFFTDTPSATQVTLVTLPSSQIRSKNDRKRHSEFIDVSRLFAQERGPQGYRLIENGNFHDRWLRCDDKLFTLGGSIKDLDRGPFTISRLDSIDQNKQQFNDAISQGTELFGPTQSTHP
ncbi:MAG: hypothetical protein K1563_12785 [Candidatus Thiodiazotropha sp. (ex. Lucinisca nassula)]|nr:hypothetical protein [Candidatus Thiodiazotropha sp. (ex. Lucinisca nassula)]MBW9274556.1 hypothetical protein [Candidatus Thiodiazotropha sp. (ex. Lucinisca nassula)]PUB82290.1 MAG: hypothetical protein DBP01_16155 [gamma proteobacterium symbiont of Ctena orbiculata]